MILNALEGKPLPVYGDGQQIRDWLFVVDHAEALWEVVSKGKVGETYNIGGHNEWANIDIVKLVCKLLNDAFAEKEQLSQQYPLAKSAIQGNAQSLIAYVTDRPGHDRRYAIDATKTTQKLGYKPVESFETGIRRTINWYLDNPEWWTPLLKL